MAGIQPQVSFEAVKSQVEALLHVSPDSVMETLVGKQLVVKLGRNRKKEEVLPLIDKMKKIAQIQFARPVFVSESGKHNSYGTDFIVKLKSTTAFAQVQRLMESNGCTLAKKYPFQNDMYILVAGKQANYDALAMANRFYETGLFDYSEPDKIVYDAHHAGPPNDPLFYLQWAHANTGTPDQYSGTFAADMKIQQAWDVTQGEPYIKVGVIDEGVDLTHPDLQANLLQGFNGSTMTSNPGDGAPLGNARAHGTNCAGIIAAIANNGVGVAGVAPHCKIIPAVIFGGTGTYFGDAAVAASFDYCRTQGASVISNSWGGGAVSSTIDAAITRAVSLGRYGKGCVVLFSSGNDNSTVSYPATNTSVVAVGGVNMCNQRKSPTTCDGETWWGANYGAGLDVVAPCVKIATTDIQGTGGYNTAAGNAGDYNNTFNGTSSACPNAAGVAALICSADSNLTVSQVVHILDTTCDKVPGYTYATNAVQPHGTWNNSTGHGRVNAYSALQLATTGNFCAVQAQAASLTYCNTPIALSVNDPDASATYQWLQNGVVVGGGTAYNASAAGTYEAVITKGSCISKSSPIVLQAPFSLLATATPDTICKGGNTILNANVGKGFYCAPAYSTGTGEGDYISLVSIATTTLNNPTGPSASPFYTTFPKAGSTTATLTANTPTPYNLAVKGGTYSECYVRGWIDYNQDGIFSASETIGVSGNVGSLSQASILFTIPASAFNGATVLRLRSDDSSPGPGTGATCSTLDYGETEDYTITIAGGVLSYTYAWTENPANGTLTGSNTAQVNANNILTNTTYTVTATSAAGCVATAPVSVHIFNTWTGNVNIDWNVPGNWSCNAVPDASADVVIPVTTNQPHLTGAVTIGALSLSGVLHLNDKSLTINGVVTGDGTFFGSALSDLIIAGDAGALKFTPGAAVLHAFTIQAGATGKVMGDLLITGP